MTNLIEYLKDKHITIIGFGKEGKSTFKLIKSLLPNNPDPIVLDSNKDLVYDSLLENVNKSWIGDSWLSNIPKTDIFFKSPGVVLPQEIVQEFPTSEITSQTEVFLRFFHERIIGITGTKGKSTCSSLCHHILTNMGKQSILAGNIGRPVFELLSSELPEWIVLELSSHQLENCKYSPHIAALLNIFEEHLDHYISFDAYALAKCNIFSHQQLVDYAVIGNQALTIVEQIGIAKPLSTILQVDGALVGQIEPSDNLIQSHLPDGQVITIDTNQWKLQGGHNIYNLIVCLQIASLCGIKWGDGLKAAYSFKGLAHRLEYVGEYHKIKFYNDSIATIPEAAIAAVKALKVVNTLILGGLNRGINYAELIDFLPVSGVQNIILLGEVGIHIQKMAATKLHGNQQMYLVNNMKEAVEIAFKHTQNGKVCLLSPAAASYDQFRNFEERGRKFVEEVTLYQPFS